MNRTNYFPGRQSRELMVNVSKNTIKIYKIDDSIDQDDWNNIFNKFNEEIWATKFNNLIYEINNYEKIFIRDGGNRYKHSKNPEYIGNSILIKNNDYYIYICNDIYEFTLTDDEIIDYESNIIRSYCNAPLAISSKRIYSMDLHRYKDILTNSENGSKYQWDKKISLWELYHNYCGDDTNAKEFNIKKIINIEIQLLDYN